MYLLLVLSLFSFVQAQIPDPANSLFTNSPGSDLRWRDCDPGTAWIHIDKFGLMPHQLHLPGQAHLSLHGFSTHDVDHKLSFHVSVHKREMGSWVHIPCTEDFGSCFYDDFCNFLGRFFSYGNCPQVATNQGLPCSCPFNIHSGKVVNINNELIHLPAVNPAYGWLNTGEYYIKMVMYENTPTGLTVRMCLEFFTSIVVDAHVTSATSGYFTYTDTTPPKYYYNVTTTSSQPSALTTPCTTNTSNTGPVPDRSDCTFQQNVARSGVRWRDCGDPTEKWIHLEAFGLLPETVHMRGEAGLTIRANTSHDIRGDLWIDVKAYKRVLSNWVRIPCTEDFMFRLGSCEYSSVCDSLTYYSAYLRDNCPKIFYDLGIYTCSCPFNLPSGKVIEIDGQELGLSAVKQFPFHWFTEGEYYVKFAMHENGQTTERMCLEFFVDGDDGFGTFREPVYPDGGHGIIAAGSPPLFVPNLMLICAVLVTKLLSRI